MPNRLFGDRSFYRHMMSIAMPIILQNLITNFVSLLDNVMVGQLSTAQIGAVTIVNNNLLFVLMLCLFGGAAGAGIFTTQFYGSADQEGIRYTFRFKMYVSLLITAIGALVFTFGCDSLVGLYLQGEGNSAVAAETLHYARQYMFIMLIGMLPFAITNAYAGTLRECGYPSVPMIGSFIAVGVNLFLNYVLIFGHFGVPALGVVGAAIATVISRYIEMAVVVLWTHLNPKKNPYIRGMYKSFYIPGKLLAAITRRGIPVMVNELLWSLGTAILNQNYSYCGLDVVPALSISTTICNLTAVVFRSLGNTAGIITGQMLGANRPKKDVQSTNTKLSVLCILSGVLFGLASVALADVFPKIYNTTDSVRQLAKWMIIICAINMPLQAYIFPVFFTLRAGGKTIQTFFFDCGSIWILCIPIAFICSHFTGLPILWIYSICLATDIIKVFIGYYLIKRGDWIQNITTK